MGKSCPMKGGGDYQDWGGDGQGLCGEMRSLGVLGLAGKGAH